MNKLYELWKATPKDEKIFGVGLLVSFAYILSWSWLPDNIRYSIATPIFFFGFVFGIYTACVYAAGQSLYNLLFTKQKLLVKVGLILGTMLVFVITLAIGTSLFLALIASFTQNPNFTLLFESAAISSAVFTVIVFVFSTTVAYFGAKKTKQN